MQQKPLVSFLFSFPLVTPFTFPTLQEFSNLLFTFVPILSQ
jgi:hypothetical protein